MATTDDTRRERDERREPDEQRAPDADHGTPVLADLAADAELADEVRGGPATCRTRYGC